MEWREKYSVGHSEMDDDHKQIFAMVDSFSASLLAGDGPDRLNTVFDELLNYMDVLDFPGARALKGLEGADPDTISNDIKDNSSEILKDVYKRGKLLYLFETYKKGYDITLLLFCSENQPAEVPVLRTMIQSWINIDPNQKPEDTSLFSVFTKADMMIMQKDT